MLGLYVSWLLAPSSCARAPTSSDVGDQCESQWLQ